MDGSVPLFCRRRWCEYGLQNNILISVDDAENWRRFCIQHAKSMAFKFAEYWGHFCIRGEQNAFVEEVIKQFTETFGEELKQRLCLIRQNNFRFHSLSSSDPSCLTNTGSTEQPCTSLQGSGKRPASIADTSFLVRSCREFSSFRKNICLYAFEAVTRRRQSSSRLSWFRSRFSSKRSVEIVKEAQLRFMSGLELETKDWRKCRTCLVKSAGGSLLEFYSPPKSSRAKAGIFCFLIMEIREATRLEFEDISDTIFVIRAFNGVEYAVETKSREDCQQWIEAIKESIPGIEWSSPNRMLRQPSAPPFGNDFNGKRPFMTSRSLNNVPVFVTSLFAETPLSISRNPFVQQLEVFPWFHSRLSRAACERLLLYNGIDGHGLFLVRLSETRLGDFVLSFNCIGKANHVRISALSNGGCRIQQLRFRSVVELLEHFRINPIPIENFSNRPIFLREYIICWRHSSLLMSNDEIDVRDFFTYSGSVSMNINDLERLVIKEQTARRQRTCSRTRLNSLNRYNFM
uniref:SH2 domain-containing protein n=1 Tax=Syphacia muris TaxID=451379 RepID=A0A0N5AN46_9BILA